MFELQNNPFFSSFSDAEITGIVPDGLDFEDLSGYELTVWAIANLPQAIRDNRATGVELANKLLTMCDKQAVAACELGLQGEDTMFLNAKCTIRAEVLSHALNQDLLDCMLVR